MPADSSGNRLAHRPDRPKVWPIEERLPSWHPGQSCVVAAKTGAGKTTSSLQMYLAQALRMNRHHVLRVEVANVDGNVVNLLPQLCRILSGVSATWLVIDGFDLIETPMKPAWCQSLSQFLNTPNLTVVITARREVLVAHGWMQELLDPLFKTPLGELTERQVAAAFEEVDLRVPTNRALLDLLKNAFLFRIYADAVSEDELPLADHGEVTAFDIVEAYWNRRVIAESQGQRAVGNPFASDTAKCAAVGYLADRTLAGDSAIIDPQESKATFIHSEDGLADRIV